MHPLIITPLYPPAVGGAATYYSHIAAALSERSEIERLTILTERFPGQPRQQQEGRLTVLRLLPTRISRPQRSHPIHAATYALTQAWFAARLPGLVKRRRVDLIHFHTRYASGILPRTLRRCRVPAIADLRDKLTDPAKLASVATRMMCCCEGAHHFAIAGGYPTDRARLVPLSFASPPHFSPAQLRSARRRLGLDDAPYLLFVGDVTYNKGALDLLQAYSRWRARHRDVKLLLVGVNRLGKTFLDALNTAEGAEYLGSRPRDDVLALMAGAEIVVLPSRSEGLPRVILEAVALGRKVIAPPNIPEFDRHIPEFVLPRVEVATLEVMLDKVWALERAPTFPFASYHLSGTVDAIVATYADAIAAPSPPTA